MSMPQTEREVRSLADAVDQLLDDMGPRGNSVCPLAKAKARIAFEPFRDAKHHSDDTMDLDEAKRIVAEDSRR